MGIIVKRITTIWELRGILSESYYGFRPSRSCGGPILQELNAKEVAEESGTEFHGSSWDIKRAFVTVPKSVLVMSWERLGVPRVVANYIVDMDRNCLTIPLIRYAQFIQKVHGMNALTNRPTTKSIAQGFYGMSGTRQGDTPSQSNWNATFDIPLRALETAQSHPLLVRTDIILSNAQDLAFADDVYSFAARRKGLQEEADIMSAAAAILGESFAPQKQRATAKSWGHESANSQNRENQLIVHDKDWTPEQILVTYANANSDHSFRYLGVYMDVNHSFDN